MRACFVFFIFVFLALGQAGLFRAITGSTQPSGNTFFENWNNQNPAGLCWDSGPSGCRNLWAVVGSAQSIEASPGTPSLAYAGKNSLLMSLTNNTSSYISAFGAAAMSVSGTHASDEYVTFYPTAHTIANFASKVLYCVGSNETCSSYAARVAMSPTGGNLQLIGAGSTTSARTGTVTLNAWHTIKLHIDTTAANCSLSLDGATPVTFTCNNNNIRYRMIGDTVGSANTATVYIGSVNAESVVGGGFPFSALFDFENGSDGDAAAVGNLGTGTKGGNGIWTVPGPAGVTISTSGQMNLESSKTIVGIQQTGSGTRGIRTAANLGSLNNNPRVLYSFVTANSIASIMLRFKINVANGSGYSIALLGATGNDQILLHYKPANSGCISSGNPYACCTGSGTGCDSSGHAYMWFGRDPALGTGADTLIGPLSTNTTYIAKLRYERGGTHSLSIYDSTGATLIGSVSYAAANAAQCTGSGTPFVCCTGSGTGCASPTNLLPNTVSLGRPGGEALYSDPGEWWIDNVVLDCIQGRLQ